MQWRGIKMMFVCAEHCWYVCNLEQKGVFRRFIPCPYSHCPLLFAIRFTCLRVIEAVSRHMCRHTEETSNFHNNPKKIRWKRIIQHTNHSYGPRATESRQENAICWNLLFQRMPIEIFSFVLHSNVFIYGNGANTSFVFSLAFMLWSKGLLFYHSPYTEYKYITHFCVER